MTVVHSSDIKSEEMALAPESNMKWTVHVEVRMRQRATARFETIQNRVNEFLQSSFERFTLPSVLTGWEEVPELASSVERIIVAESACPMSSLRLEDMSLQIHVYQTSDSDPFEEYSSFNNSGSSGEDDTMAASVCELPNQNLDGLWDSLIYADDIKLKLLDYIHATLVFSDANVDFNLISWNRVVLLHGPPGTGKTSLCRALAQKLSIRLSRRYPNSRLLEINSHSLFSRWFSESGKLVQRLFSSITELVEEEDTFVVVLIDEVESLTAARAGAMAGTEPSDGLRVVNALLTQLDKLKHRKNVLIMSTSNLAKAIDSAFVDRADIVQYVDLPPREAIYDILRTCLCEIISKGIIAPATIPTFKQAQLHELSSDTKSLSLLSSASSTTHDISKSLALRLLALSTECRKQGLSGRALRRLPVLALARHIGKCATTGVHVASWLDGLEKVVSEKAAASEKLI
ncbi:hypothetical protein EYR40_005480 [Pleurotus pulmonarius]|nr:hypothetical protein EYR36_006132 [Pleurotus pulmonarius]KAF4600839.1 hypothetical protein EYR38_005484 [Pleurotus pulmonarius]KAF4602275.1 hypothetical protein EYR40_005480 [Pleurotus pulmonarius]